MAELRQELAPFASQQFREIWVSVDPGGTSLAALMNTNVGWLTYWKGHDHGDPGFSSRNPMYDESDATLGGLAYDSLYEASWALPRARCQRALEYFVEHEGRRPAIRAMA